MKPPVDLPDSLQRVIDDRRDDLVDLAHKPDEYVAIDDLVSASKVMALAARSLLHEST